MPSDWISKWAKYTPGRLALRDHAGGRELTYRECDARISALRIWLKKDMGIGVGERIAILSENSLEHPLLFFAAIGIGAILVPLNFRLTVEELSVLMKDSQPSLLLYSAGQEEKAAALKDRHTVGKLQLIGEVFGQSDKYSGRGDKHMILPADDDPLMILYTSGTTGVPKGAVITAKMLFYNSINTEMRLDITSQDHTLGFAPFFHTGGWNVLLTPFLHHGASHTLLDKFDPDLILELIEKEGVTLLFGVPTMLQMMADSPRFAATDLSSLRYLIVGGAPMPIPLIHIWHGRGVFVRQGYGLTEVGPNCFSLHQDDAERKKGSIGFPNFYIETRVEDESGRVCGANEVGELCLRSPVVTPGYWQKPAESAAAIREGWFHTGDMVRFDEEDFFYVVDRKKNMFISGGENVYPAEVEAVLNSIPGVVESAVIGIPHEKWGEVGRAFIVRHADSADGDLMIAECRNKLAKYKIPKEWVFIKELPRNDAGKIDRKALINRGE